MVRVRPGLITVAVLATLAATPASASQRPRLSTGGFGPLEIGMSTRAANRAVSSRSRITSQPGPGTCSFWTWNRRASDSPVAPGVQLLASEGRTLDSVMVYSRGIYTTKAVRVGDRTAKLRRRYRSLLRQRGAPELHGGTSYIVRGRSGPHRTMLRFVVSGGRILTITLGTVEFMQTYVECS